jgi:hypothetical protein
LINNIFYDLLWEFLEEHNVKHTKVIAFIFSNIIPFIVAVVTVGVIYIIVKREVTGKDSSPRPITGSEPARDVLDTPQKLSKIESRTEPQYLTVSEAIRYLADESEWGARIRAAPPNAAGLKQIPRFAAIDELVRAARNGDLKVFGRFNRTGEHLLISAQYWLYASIDMGSAIGANISGIYYPN